MQTATLIPGYKRRWTDNELMSLPRDGNKYELIDGDLLVSPVGNTHSQICIRLSSMLHFFVRRKKLGRVYDSSMGFRLSPKILLSPDVSFVSNDRLAKILVAPEKFLYGAPDLAVEVLSPGDDLEIIDDKLEKYFEHGTKIAWVVDPKRAILTVHQPDSVVKLTRLTEVVNGGEVLRGFKCRLSEILLD